MGNIDFSKMFAMNEDDQDLPPVPFAMDYQAPAPQKVAALDPIVMASLKKKYPGEQLPEMSDDSEMSSAPAPMAKPGILDTFSDENYQKAKADADERKSGLGWLQFGAGLGDAIAGRDSSQTARNFQGIRDNIDKDTVGDFEKRKGQAVADVKTKKMMDETDPNSAASQSFRKMIERSFPDVAKSYGESWANVSAGDQENIFKPLQLKEQIDARREQARILAGDRQDKRDQLNFDKQNKRDEKMQGLKTPYGLANNEDDAKKIKEAHESKKNFDSKIKEMIALREKHGGGTIMNRDDVARGKQLSKDLLLEYKNMAKLGVLSQSDEKIINAIIPEDPLEYNSIAASLQGQDPVLHKLKSFKNDSDNDFATRVSTRVRDGAAVAEKMQPQMQKQVVKRQVNQKTGQVRLVYNDGSSEVVSSNVAGGN